MSKIEDVKKIRHDWIWYKSGKRRCQRCHLVLPIAHIKVPPCQLSEPKPEAVRLLTSEEMQTVIYSIPAREPGEDYSRLMEATCKAQLAKDMEWEDKRGFIKEAECQAKIEAYQVANRDLQDLNIEALKQEQARIEGIFKEIRGVTVGAYQANARNKSTLVETDMLSGLDNLKKREGVK